MFTVKATYRNETRRFTFPDSIVFPTYGELYHQLYRVFPISHNYYLSRLIFSPDASRPGRILVGKEVHTAEDYNSSVAPLRRLWPNPLLRFTVFDETPHKASRMNPERSSPYSVLAAPLSASREASFVESTCDLTVPLSSQSFVPPPPPPPPPPFSTCISPPLPPPSKTTPPPPTITKPGLPQCTVAVEPCCSITKGKADIETLLSSFKEDLDAILRRTLGSSHAKEQINSPFVPSIPTAAACGAAVVLPQTKTPLVNSATSASSRWCFLCKTRSTGVWYGCNKCPWHAICSGCFSKSPSTHTLSFGPSHVVQLRSIDGSTQDSAQSIKENKPCSAGPTENASLSLTSEPALSVHHGVICDSCNSTVKGVRHKCSDCPDYDLCTACVESGATEQHNPFHEFIDIEKPACVYVRASRSDDRERRTHQQSGLPAETQQRTAANATNPPTRHTATCNLCDSAIVGERYKCVVCPDFDTCSSCFRITTEQHPNHGFVRVNNPEDLMMRYSVPLRQATHLALCNSCQKPIRGARYKCMHPGCPDFDLCSDCEALPIPVHPLNHPMLKLRTSESVIPIVHQAGQSQATSEPNGQKSAPVRCETGSRVSHPRSPLTAPMKSSEVTPVVVSEQATNVTTEDQIPSAEEFLSPLGSPASTSEVLDGVPTSATVAPSHLLVDVADPLTSPQSDQPPLDIYYRLWPRVNQEMVHLIALQVPKAEDPVGDPVENTVTEPISHEPLAVEESLPGTPILHVGERYEERLVSLDQGNKSIVDGHPTPSSTPPAVRESHPTTKQLTADDQQEMVTRDAARESIDCLDSSLVGDINVPDGQVFPPGAEFVKGWHMMNIGGLPWPPTTEIQFVAGENLAPECSASLRAKVGYVHPGENLDIWTGDLKAPDVPGRYVGYWRLNDGQGNFFGSNVWIDLTVADHLSDQASEHSLAASSMVMPSAHPNDLVNARNERLDAPQSSVASTKTVTDEIEGAESDISSVSLVSVPTSDDEDAEWQDTRTHSEPLEYVVLYDNHSEE